MSTRVRLLPQLPVPVVQTPQLAASLAWYVDVLGFALEEHVPHTVALLRLGGVRLQLWQVPDARPQDCCLVVNGASDCIFGCHARAARMARTWIGPAPALRPWGAWEFCLADPQGNQLRFIQWPVAPVPDAEHVPRPERRP